MATDAGPHKVITKGLFVIIMFVFFGFFASLEMARVSGIYFFRNTENDASPGEDILDNVLDKVINKRAAKKDDTSNTESPTMFPSTSDWSTNDNNYTESDYSTSSNTTYNGTEGTNGTTTSFMTSPVSPASTTTTNETNTTGTTTTGTTTTGTTSTATTTTITTSAPSLKGPCFDKPYQLSQLSCSIDIRNQTGIKDENITLEDVSDMLFIPSIVRHLKDCPPGVWCITSGYKIVQDNEEFLDFCTFRFAECLLNIPDDCLDEERRYIIATLIMMCALDREENVTDRCMTSVRKMTHVTLSDYQRSRDSARPPLDICENEEQRNNCTKECHDLSSSLHCMVSTCDNKMDMFTEFDPWRWFFIDGQSSMSLCGLASNDTDCIQFEGEESWFYRLMHSYKLSQAFAQLDPKITAAIATSVVVSVIAMIVILTVCLRRVRSRKYNMRSDGYSEVQSEDADDEDTDEDTA